MHPIFSQGRSTKGSLQFSTNSPGSGVTFLRGAHPVNRKFSNPEEVTIFPLYTFDIRFHLDTDKPHVFISSLGFYPELQT